MPVRMVGGTSGNREDALPPDVSFERQPIETTETSGPIPSTIHMTGGPTGNSVNYPLPDVPTGGTPDDSNT